MATRIGGKHVSVAPPGDIWWLRFGPMIVHAREQACMARISPLTPSRDLSFGVLGQNVQRHLVEDVLKPAR